MVTQHRCSAGTWVRTPGWHHHHFQHHQHRQHHQHSQLNQHPLPHHTQVGGKDSLLSPLGSPSASALGAGSDTGGGGFMTPPSLSPRSPAPTSPSPLTAPWRMSALVEVESELLRKKHLARFTPQELGLLLEEMGFDTLDLRGFKAHRVSGQVGGWGLGGAVRDGGGGWRGVCVGGGWDDGGQARWEHTHAHGQLHALGSTPPKCTHTHTCTRRPSPLSTSSHLPPCPPCHPCHPTPPPVLTQPQPAPFFILCTPSLFKPCLIHASPPPLQGLLDMSEDDMVVELVLPRSKVGAACVGGGGRG